MAAIELANAEEMARRLQRLIAGSPADSTEATWVEARRSQVTNGQDSPSVERERTILIRVRQSGRTGLHRTGGAETSDLENALRVAMAQARLAAPSPQEPLAPGEPSASDPSPSHDQALADLAPAAARALLHDCGLAKGERCQLRWVDGRVAVANSAGTARHTQVTAAAATVRCGNTPGAGSGFAAARRLASLALDEALSRARERHAPSDGAAVAWEPSDRLVLSEASAAALLDLLNRHGLGTAAWRDRPAAAWPRVKLGERIAAACFSVRDDATLATGLPFPFDLGGWTKRPVDLIAEGVFLSPAVDTLVSQQTGLPATPHSLGPDESLATNLVLWPGPGDAAVAGLSEKDLLRQAEGGLWLGELANVAEFDANLVFRATARGVRRIRHGELQEGLPDLRWEDSLAELLTNAVALGDRPRPIATGDILFGATMAPLLALRAGGKLEPEAGRR